MKKQISNRIKTLHKKTEELWVIMQDEYGLESSESTYIDNVLHMVEELTWIVPEPKKQGL